MDSCILHQAVGPTADAMTGVVASLAQMRCGSQEMTYNHGHGESVTFHLTDRKVRNSCTDLEGATVSTYCLAPGAVLILPPSVII